MGKKIIHNKTHLFKREKFNEKIIKLWQNYFIV